MEIDLYKRTDSSPPPPFSKNASWARMPKGGELDDVFDECFIYDDRRRAMKKRQKSIDLKA
jgi:hypothetical protein